MKKSKILMPIIGIAAIGSSIAPLTTLTSCNKGQNFKVELSKGTTERQLYANTKTLSLFFKQNDLTNYTKIRAKLANLKINGATVAAVEGLFKFSVDAAGGMRITLNIATMYKHYSNPSSIEFDVVFHNKATGEKYTVEGFKLNIDQDTEVPNPFAKDGTVITGFNTEAEGYGTADFASSWDEVFVPITIPALSVSKVANKLEMDEPIVGSEEEKKEEEKTTEDETKEKDSKKEEDTQTIYYKMVIPASFTGIDKEAFYEAPSTQEEKGTTTIPSVIKALEFAPDSKMESIGIGAFVNAPFNFITLPPSIKELGHSCFCSMPYLTSIQFPAELNHNEGLAIPYGFVQGSAISYLKLPTYITQIGYGDKKIACFSETLYLDFGEWSDTQIEALVFGQNAIISPIVSGIFTHGGDKCLAAFNKKLKELGLSSITNEIAYEFKPSGNEAIFVAPAPTAFANAFQTIAAKATTATRYPLFKFELPNYYTPDSSTTSVKVTSFDDNVCKFIMELNKNEAVSSLYLPIYLTSLGDKLIQNIDCLWQLSIPATISSMPAKTIAVASNLSSIIYGGTSAEWDTLISKSDKNWIVESPEIKVWCADGKTRTVTKTIKDEAA